METTKPSFGPLDDVKVVYSAVEIAAPTAAEIMAEWGADVTWIENTWTGDSMRDTTWTKEMERRNQRSISINTFSDEGKEILLRLVGDADIFIEASKGPTFARKGITDDMLWEANPKLVIVHVSGFGQWGDPERVNSAAYDLTVAAYAGIIAQNGTPEQPTNIAPYSGDYFNSLIADGKKNNNLPTFILTSGGTGLNTDDQTVEAVRPHLDKEIPGIMHSFWANGLQNVSSAVLSRGVAGVIDKTFVMTLPGSRGGVKDGVKTLDPLVEHICRQMEDYHDH